MLGKRERLVAGAQLMLHRQGVEKTTLAEIAEAADVPVGNVYYYFKSKDELVSAAIDGHVEMIRATLADLAARHRTPKARLKALVRMIVDQRDMVATSGCPHGSLSAELAKRGDAIDDQATKLLGALIDWAEEQFRAIGGPSRRNARDLAVALMASYQGIALLSHTFHDPELMVREGRRLEKWIDSLS
jgi:TetR/AcrR family transcriptional regulator, transcriptional repressor for nem operon